jgi:hypothetical protein
MRGAGNFISEPFSQRLPALLNPNSSCEHPLAQLCGRETPSLTALSPDHFARQITLSNNTMKCAIVRITIRIFVVEVALDNPVIQTAIGGDFFVVSGWRGSVPDATVQGRTVPVA